MDKLVYGDSFEEIKKIRSKSIDMVFADPPYFLSSNGVTNVGGKMVSVNKADWDKSLSFKEKHKFNKRWIRLVKRVLKDDGTIWISGTLHNIYSIGVALEECGFKILNNITWQKTNPPPNLACKVFTHSTETILWATKNIKKTKHYFNYKLMKEINLDKQMKDVWTSSLVSQKEKQFGKHPTQKPLWLLERVILASTQENDIVLDPFMGSGTTCVAAKKLNRRYIGIDSDKEFVELAKKRVENENGILSIY